MCNIATVSIELAGGAMFLQWRSERRRYRDMILRQWNNDSKGVSEEERLKDAKLKNKELNN